MPKGTYQTEATPNNEMIKLVALVVIELCLTKDISQSGSQSEKNSAYFIL